MLMATPTPTPSRLHRHLLPVLPSRPPLASSSFSSSQGLLGRRPSSRLHCSSPPVDAAPPSGSVEYRPSFADDLLLAYFRAKMVEVVGWDSEKPGYTGLMEVANRLMTKGKSALETEQSAVRVLRSLFPPLLLVLFKALLAPIANGQLASMMVARATALSCQWLMGPCSVNSITLADGKSLSSGVFVEKCKYLEESKCLGICINTCKLPTQVCSCMSIFVFLQIFFFPAMPLCLPSPKGIVKSFWQKWNCTICLLLFMEPNFEDYSCQFNFGVPPPPLDTDQALKEPCLDICTNARRRRGLGSNSSPDSLKCPQV